MNWTARRELLVGERNQMVLPPKIKLPMLPHAILEFNRRAENPNASSGELGKIIESDSGLTCELLRYANSATFARRTKAATAQQAIALIGIRGSKLFLMSTGVQQAMKSSQSKLINIQAFWLTNLERAIFSREVAKRLRTDGDLAYAASLLHDFLLPLLANEMFDQYLQFLQTPEAVRRPLCDFERSAFGWDHALATGQVLLGWSFPDDLICCALLHHAGLNILCDPELGRTAAAAVAVAALIPDALRQSGDGLTALQQLNSVWPDFNLDAVAQSVAAELVAQSPLASQHFTLARRLEKSLAVASK